MTTKVKKTSGVGKTETQYMTFAQDRDFVLSGGERFGPVTIAYETYGTLNVEKSNAVLVVHALSGDAHAAGMHQGDSKPGWWDAMIGPGRAFDTEKYFVICCNILGGCRGSTGPSSINPATGKPYGLSFPAVSIGDMVECQRILIESFRIEKLLCVVGGSMGGMQVLEWMVRFPEKIRSAVPVATALRHTPQQIAFDEVGRQAIMSDPDWKNGDYYGGNLPARGLAVARMLGHITYMSDKSMIEKFGRHRKQNGVPFKFLSDFEVAGYLNYRGESFVKRFDANSYLYITRAMDEFDPLHNKTLHDVFRELKAHVLVIAFASDWLYPPYQSKEIVRACKHAGVDTTYCEILSTYGHDAFLLEIEEQSHLISHFIKRVEGNNDR